MSLESNITSMANNTCHLACDTDIIMMASPRYCTPDTGCLSHSHNIHHGQKVSVLGRFLCCMKSKYQEGPVHQTSPV